MSNGFRRPGMFGGGSFFFPPAIKYLLIINIGVFVLEHLFLGGFKVGNTQVTDVFLKYFALWPIVSKLFLPWQLISYMFLHGDFMHLFFNMFALWMFGIELEHLWGTKKFLIYYFACGLGAGIANLFLAPLFSPPAPTVGASGAIYGILVAFGYLFPDRYIYIYFMIPVKAKFLVIFYMALEVYSVASQSNTGIAHIAHLGGAVVGFVYLLITQSKKGTGFFDNFKSKKSDFESFFSQKRKDNYTGFTPFDRGKNKDNIKDTEYTDIKTTDYKEEANRKEKDLQEKIDTILDKIAKNGYQSLTDEEKRTLFEEGKKLR